MATLVEHFHLTLEEIGRLTDRQIDEIYWHHRNDKGEIEVKQQAPASCPPPERVTTLPQILKQVDGMMGLPGMNRMKIAKLKEEVKAKWKAKSEGIKEDNEDAK